MIAVSTFLMKGKEIHLKMRESGQNITHPQGKNRLVACKEMTMCTVNALLKKRTEISKGSSVLPAKSFLSHRKKGLSPFRQPTYK